MDVNPATPSPTPPAAPATTPPAEPAAAAPAEPAAGAPVESSGQPTGERVPSPAEIIAASRPSPGVFGPPTADQPAAARPPIRLVRSRTDRVLGGVCGGLSDVLKVDAVILRLALVLATVLGFGIGVVLYLACWILMPQEPAPSSQS